MNERAGATAESMSIGRSVRIRMEKQIEKLEKQVADLSKHLATTEISTNNLGMKVRSNHDVMQQIFSFLGDIETRLEAFKTMGIRNDHFTVETYEAVWDEIKGLRVRRPDEQVHVGDHARITYKATDEKGTIVMEDKDFPISLSNNILLMQSHLVGKRVDSKNIQFGIHYPEDYKSRPDLAGKELAFDVSFDKVKCKIKGDINAN